MFDLREDDVFWCTADVGWITGHSYVAYGPLASGATVVIYEGAPTCPHAGRFWEICERYAVTVFYTAPTAIRALMKLGDGLPAKYDLSSLRLLGTVGEPINPEAWMWYHRVIGNGNCPIVDTWWQTETGGIMISPAPGVTVTKPGSCTQPLPGVQAAILDENGEEITEPDRGGYLVIRHPGRPCCAISGATANAIVRPISVSSATTATLPATVPGVMPTAISGSWAGSTTW